MSVGAQSESCVVVPQHGGDGLDVHAVLEGQGGEGVTQVVEPKVFQTSILENPLMQRGYGIRVVHTSGAGGGEEPGIGWVLGVFSHQQLHRLLGDGDLADEVLCLGTGNHECARFILRGLLADGDGPLLHVQVFPPQGYHTTGEVAALFTIGSREDRRQAQPIMDLAEEAFSGIGLTEAEARNAYGKLSQYAYPIDVYEGVVNERHTLKLLSAHFEYDEGLLWVYYSREGLDRNGEVMVGSWEVESLWRVARTKSGQWKLYDIKEHP